MNLRKWLAAAAVLVAVAAAGHGARAADAATAKLNHNLNLAVEYPQTGNKDIDRSIQDWLEEHIEETMAGFNGVAVRPEYEGGSVDVAIGYDVSQPSERAVSFIFETMASPSGAAHPTTRVDVMNFDLESGHWLALEDLFGYPDKALEIMAANAKAAVNEELAKIRPDQYPHGLDEKSDSWFSKGFEPTAENYAALVLAPGGVKVIFQQYQVLPYAMGMPEAFFPLKELEPAKPHYQLWED